MQEPTAWAHSVKARVSLAQVQYGAESKLSTVAYSSLTNELKRSVQPFLKVLNIFMKPTIFKCLVRLYSNVFFLILALICLFHKIKFDSHHLSQCLAENKASESVWDQKKRKRRYKGKKEGKNEGRIWRVCVHLIIQGILIEYLIRSKL